MASKPPIHLSPDLDPWERQPGESNKQYSRFRTYMELGRTRTLKQAVEILHGTLDDRISYRVLQQYAYEGRWTERAEAHDLFQDQQEVQRLLLLRREMQARHRKLATGLMAKAVTALHALKPEELTALDIVRMTKHAAELERAALGEPERTIAVAGQGGGPIITQDFTHYTAEERRARLEQISIELGRRAALRDDDEDD